MSPPASAEVVDRMTATGAVLVGRHTAEQADHYQGDHHGVPILVLSHPQQQALAAGVLDEIQIDQVPVLLGAGRRLFHTLAARIELDIVQVLDTPQDTHIRYRVRR